jgi:anti-sigma factor RsiW
MSCDCSDKVDRYVDAELFDAELAEMEVHLRDCAECASAALSRLQWKRMTQAAGRRYSPQPEFRHKIERSIATKRSRWAIWQAASLAAAAALALALIGAGIWLRHSRTQQTLGELADLHVSTLASANPVDVLSTDRHTVKPWFQGKLPFSFNLPELQNSPFKLIGGRLAYFQQSPGAQLLFGIGKHQISVFIFQNRGELSGLNSGSWLRKKLAFSTETWAEGGLRYFIVGDASAADVHELSEVLKSAAL